MYYKFLKLTNGDDLIVTTENEYGNWNSGLFMEVSDPVAIHSVRMPYRDMIVESFIMQPWIKMAKDEVVRIPVNNIIVATNVVEKAEVQYKEFIQNYKVVEEEIEQQVDQGDQPSDEEVLEKFYNIIHNDSEEDEHEEPITRPTFLH